MTEAASISAGKTVAVRFGRWWQLSLGVVCMSMIANLQYGWTLFVNPIHDTPWMEPVGNPGRVHSFRIGRDLARPD